jgi:hypothetical protein
MIPGSEQKIALYLLIDSEILLNAFVSAELMLGFVAKTTRAIRIIKRTYSTMVCPSSSPANALLNASFAAK